MLMIDAAVATLQRARQRDIIAAIIDAAGFL